MPSDVTCTALLVEDDAESAFLFQRSVRPLDANWALNWVKNGVEAVKFCVEQGPPGIVITDLGMPHMGGMEVVAWLRSQSLYRGTWITVLTLDAEPEMLSRCRLAGADDVISKTADAEELCSRFRETLSSLPRASQAVAPPPRKKTARISFPTLGTSVRLPRA